MSYRRTIAITTTIAMPMSNRTPTTATTDPTTAPILGISLVDGAASRVTFTARVEKYQCMSFVAELKHQTLFKWLDRMKGSNPSLTRCNAVHKFTMECVNN